jgi:hypothetical protein
MPLTEMDLVEAAKRRILRELEREQAAQVVNNLTQGGGGMGGAQGQSIQDMMGSGTPEDWDYFVDITREDLPDVNPATGKPKGWKKSVHRFTNRKGEEPPPVGKKRSGGR